MKAQASKSGDIPVTQEVTPVIIKIGGGDTGPAGTAKATKTGTYDISIASDFMTFEDQSGASWKQASSTLPGRIHELTLSDGDMQPVYCKVMPQPNALTSVEVTFQTAPGLEKLHMEEKPNGNDFLLEMVSSSVDFNVTQAAPHGGWKASTATFSGKPVEVTLKQLNGTEELVVFHYLFNHDEISLGLEFHYKQ